MTYEELGLTLQSPLRVADCDETLMGEMHLCAYYYRGFTYTVAEYTASGEFISPPCPVRNELLGQWMTMRRDVLRGRR